MSVSFYPRSAEPYVSTPTTEPFIATETSDKIIFYDGFRAGKFWAYDNQFKKYYSTETGSIDKKYLRRDMAYEATQINNKLRLK